MKNLYERAMKVAQTYDVSTPENGLVLYSVSFLPTKENRDKAFAYVKENPDKMVIEHTDCGAKLVELGLASADSGLTPEQVADIWAAASKRLINCAKGNVRAFVKNAHPRSVFRRMELPSILANPEIKKINSVNKKEFARKFEL